MASRQKFIRQLKQLAFSGVFNPYTDRCEIRDKVDAPNIRERNLASLMDALEGRVGSIWFGRDLGYRGGRRTGLALTDEAHLKDASIVFGTENMELATHGPISSERTASTVWRVLKALDKPPFLWNIFPFHPYVQGDPDSNRCHGKEERRKCAHLLESLLDWAGSCQLVAIGNDAASGLSEFGLQHLMVRHPSYGGVADFLSGMSRIYDVNLASEIRQPSLLGL